ncbi:AAA family ATPase [Streptosporangium lutulentum]|uniref:ATPase n=1 Tax=Streptosporangium lutulentum TaxID=1461250 RepID=A0ABT9Q4S8_9ACTN|nr:AAA family ATPase [Streptosporangium lutulentum]MDP9841693.1 putative ATPase [Streptosporangium lutulentum]
MTTRRLTELRVENFRSLKEIKLPLGPINVLVGPNGAGKTNVLRVFDFLADVVRTDLGPALDNRGGFDHLMFRGGDEQENNITVGLMGTWSATVGGRPDEYTMMLHGGPLERDEIFDVGLPDGRRRRIWVDDENAITTEYGADESLFESEIRRPAKRIGLNTLSSGLSTLPRLSEEFGSREVTALADFLSTFRIFDVDVTRACLPSRVSRNGDETIADNASNLAGFLLMLRDTDEEAWERLQADAVEVLPQLEALDFEYPSGGAHAVVVVLRERGLRDTTPLLDASYGTIRLLGLLAMLYDPNPPALTCVEEIDHGLHPQALELLVERIREASERTQFIIATHSPAFADRLQPEELIVCERGEDGSSMIPAISIAQVEEIVRASEGMPLGELWFSGALGGDL